MSTAYVLSGGGAKGAFQVGVIQQLEKQGIKPDALYGTSVGALNAAGYAYSGIDYMYNLWIDIEGKKWYKPWTPSADILSFNWSTLVGFSDGLYNLNPLAAQLNKHLVGPPTCEAVVCAVNLETGEVKYTSSKNTTREDFLKATIGSATIPTAMSPIDGVWVDGGVREQTPVMQAVLDGHENIIIVSCNPLVPNSIDPWTMPGPFLKLINLGWRAVNDLMEHQIFLNGFNPFRFPMAGSNVKFQVYAPDILLMDTLEFDPVKIKNAIAAGQVAVPITAPPF